MEKNGKDSGPLTSLPVDRLISADFNGDARASASYDLMILKIYCPREVWVLVVIIRNKAKHSLVGLANWS